MQRLLSRWGRKVAYVTNASTVGYERLRVELTAELGVTLHEKQERR
jgi:hypothetical protein